MEPGLLIIAGLAAAGVLLIVLGLSGSSPVDPVQARLTQLGSMQAKNLEELELQAPFVERTLRPLMARLLRPHAADDEHVLLRHHGAAPGAGRQPGRHARRRLARHQGGRRDRRRRSCSSSCSSSSASCALPIFLGVLMIPVGALFGYIAPGVLARRRVRRASTRSC